MTYFTKYLTAGALALGMTAGMAGAATVSLEGSSVQGVGNTAGIGYAQGFGANLPVGASWSVDPTWTPPAGNVSGQSQTPFNNTTLQETQNYFTVGGVAAPGGALSPVTLTFTTAQDAFRILWGSIDDYNTIKFFSGLAEVFSYTGEDLVTQFGLGGAAPNYEDVALLNFGGFENGFTSVKFISDSAAFEFALAPVPLPAGGLLLIGALGGLAALRRRKTA